jgi:hypothetical protein
MYNSSIGLSFALNLIMRFLLCFIIIVLSLSCSNSTNRVDKNQLSSSFCDLPDSLFPFDNISNSLFAERFYYDTTNSCYTDSTKKIKLTSLSATQKKQFIDSIPPYSRDWIVADWQVYFVSKQHKIGSLTPIIVSAGGTDFTALILVLLDSTCHPISNFILSGGECGDDPIECDFKQSFLNGRQIKSSVRTVIDKNNFYTADSLIVDSVNYTTQILLNGRFETRKTDSIRYKRRSFSNHY